MTAAEVTVVAMGGARLRRLACALGLHQPREGPAPSGGPTTIRFCIWCGESSDRRWSWVYTEHRWDLGPWISFVKYREVGA